MSAIGVKVDTGSDTREVRFLPEAEVGSEITVLHKCRSSNDVVGCDRWFRTFA
jgi:hypothetical protein